MRMCWFTRVSISSKLYIYGIQIYVKNTLNPGFISATKYKYFESKVNLHFNFLVSVCSQKDKRQKGTGQ